MFSKFIIAYSLTILILGFLSCKIDQTEAKQGSSYFSDPLFPLAREGKSYEELNLIRQGLVNIQDVDPTIKIDLRYSTTNNFVGIDLYGDLDKIYAQYELAEKLKKAQDLLQELNSTLCLLVFDGVRPLHIQQTMWDTLDMPLFQKVKFLSNPVNHSVHNYGVAVDLTIMDNTTNEELDMGTPYDYFGKLCQPSLEKYFLETGELTQEQLNNRVLLRKVMVEAGFRQLETEWWHYNSCSRWEAKEKYNVVE